MRFWFIFLLCFSAGMVSVDANAWLFHRWRTRRAARSHVQAPIDQRQVQRRKLLPAPYDARQKRKCPTQGCP